MSNLLQGERVRLTAKNAETDVEAFTKWSYDSEFRRFQDSEIARPKSNKQIAERYDQPDDDSRFMFIIRPVLSEEPLGFTILRVVWAHGDAWLGVGIGDRNYWGRGYGSEAVRLTLDYAFDELNLQRVSLTTLEANGRGRRAYEKCGFVYEGMLREASRYDGELMGEIFMGVLRSEWEARQTK